MTNKYPQLVIFVLLISLNTWAQKPTASPVPISNEKGIQTSCPFFTKNQKGVPVMSFIKKDKAKESLLCFSEFDISKNKFKKPILIEASRGLDLHPENAPKIIYKPKGEILAIWGVSNASEKKKYAGLIKYSQSFDNGKTWTKAYNLVQQSQSIDQRYFDVDLLSNGEVAIIWLDSRTDTDKEGSTLYYAATVGKSGFQNEKPIAKTTCQCCRTDLFVGADGTINAAFRDIINEEFRDMVLSYSQDNGKTFSQPKRISPDNWKINGCPHTGPTMGENLKGLHFAWYTSGGGAGVYYCNSTDYGKSFAKRNIVSDKPSARHPQLCTVDNKDVFIVWDEAVSEKEHISVKIALQRRDKNGKILWTKYLSQQGKTAIFPIIKAVNNKQLIVAWNQDENVYYKTLNLF